MMTTSEGAAGGAGRPTGGLSLAVAVARRVHLDGASKVQVAAELGITRFKVARLLDMAHEAGLDVVDDSPNLLRREAGLFDKLTPQVFTIGE